MYILRSKTYDARIKEASDKGFYAGIRHAASVTESAASEYAHTSGSTYNTKTAVCAQLRKLAEKLRNKAKA